MAIVIPNIGGPVMVTRLDFPLIGLSAAEWGWFGTPLLGSTVIKPPAIVNTFQIEGATKENGAKAVEMAAKALRRNGAL